MSIQSIIANSKIKELLGISGGVVNTITGSNTINVSNPTGNTTLSVKEGNYLTDTTAGLTLKTLGTGNAGNMLVKSSITGNLEWALPAPALNYLLPLDVDGGNVYLLLGNYLHTDVNLLTLNTTSNGGTGQILAQSATDGKLDWVIPSPYRLFNVFADNQAPNIVITGVGTRTLGSGTQACLAGDIITFSSSINISTAINAVSLLSIESKFTNSSGVDLAGSITGTGISTTFTGEFGGGSCSNLFIIPTTDTYTFSSILTYNAIQQIVLINTNVYVRFERGYGE